MNTMLWSVSGIQNKECKTQIKNALDKIEGIHKVEINAADSTVEVEYKDPACPDEIQAFIENTGFKIIPQ